MLNFGKVVVTDFQVHSFSGSEKNIIFEVTFLAVFFEQHDIQQFSSCCGYKSIIQKDQMWANLSSLTGSYVLNQKADLQVVTPALEVEDWTNTKRKIWV